MPIGNLTAFITYIMQILFSVMMATFMFTMLPRAAASAEAHPGGARHRADRAATRTAPATPSESRGLPRVPRRRVPLPRRRGPGAAATSPSRRGPGETTAIIGSTGSGKSTLINLIPRFYDVTGGSVLVDGVDVREMAQEDLWRKIGFIPQRAFLFSGTVASNLRYGDEDATDEELWHALRGRAGRGLRRRDARGARGADRAGRHERLRRPAPAPRDRPRAREAARDLRVRRQLLGARLQDRLEAARRAARARRARRPSSSSRSA